MSVSRVEYDAALKRVQRAYHGRWVCTRDRCVCKSNTLAALGLDEPPTEAEPFDVRDHPMAFPSHHEKRWVPSDDSPVPSDRSPTAHRVVPPTETPKARERRCTCTRTVPSDAESRELDPACPWHGSPKARPTCEVSSEWAVRGPCPDCGSGIDGRTA